MLGIGISPFFTKGKPGSSFDADAQLFMATLGIPNNGTVYYAGTGQERTGAQLWTVVNNFVLECKGTGVVNQTIDFWSKLKAFHPFIGGTAPAHKWNLKNPLDTDGAYRLTFAGGWTHSSTGATPNGSNAYADTHLSPSVSFTASNANFGRYNGSSSNSGVELGVANAGNSATWACFTNYGGTTAYNTVNAYGVSVADNVGLGLYCTNRNSGNITNGFRNGIQVDTGTETAAVLTDSFYYGAMNQGGSASFFDVKQIRCGHFMDGLTNAENLVWYNIIQAMQVALGRPSQIAVFYGDSVTAGVGATTSNLRWSSLVCAYKGWQEVNNGIAGTTLQSAVPVDVIAATNMYDRRTTIPTYNSTLHSALFISYGINDCGLNFATYSVANFTTQLTAIVNHANATKGWPMDKIVIQCSTFVNPAAWNFYEAYGVLIDADTTRFVSIQTAAYGVALLLGNIFLNPYQTMIDNGGLTLLNDDRHPNDAGYLVIKNYMTPLITSL